LQASVSAQPIPAKSIAVLPFENLSTDKGNAYFADGMQDLILTKLADIGDLKVISRTSTAKYASHPDDLKAIAQQLGVATILEGSVQKAGNQVLINVQLIDAQTDNHLWAEAYPRTLDNIFGVEGEVAQKVADALKAKLTAAESARVGNVPTTNTEAYTLYLKAEHESTQFYEGDGQSSRLRQAAQYLIEAIAHDPRFALAYAKLATIQGDLLVNSIEDSPELRHDELANARRALTLQPDLAEAHMVLGGSLIDSGDNEEGLRELQTAARLAPNDANVPFMLAQLHVGTGDWQQASDEIARARRLDPRNVGIYGWSAVIDTTLRRYAQARQMLEQGLAISPQAQNLLSDMARLMTLLGQPRAALEQITQMPDQTQDKYQQLASAFLLLRDGAQALTAAERIPLPSRYTDAGDREMLIAEAALASDDRPRGAAALEKARSDVLAALQKHPDTPDLYDRLAQIEARRGQRAAALQAIDKAVALAAASPTPGSRIDAGHLETKAEVLAYLGDAKGATAILDNLLTTPGTGMSISPALLKLDPVWDPIRNDQRFQSLLKKYANKDAVEDAPDGEAAAHG
jgi:serine/threonine-protein kinase